MREPELEGGPGIPTTLRIRFARSERPHQFWVSGWTSAGSARIRYKILSKRSERGEVEALVVQEAEQGMRIALGRVRIPPGTPSDWMGRWVHALAGDLGVRFDRVDVPGTSSLTEWRAWARKNGWARGGRR